MTTTRPIVGHHKEYKLGVGGVEKIIGQKSIEPLLFSVRSGARTMRYDVRYEPRFE